ncbi:MAG: hypothetical protein WKG52_00895 [Variovorax sp.]
MDILEFPLLGRLNAPSVVSEQWVRAAKTYRHAVRIAWALRRIKGAKPAHMAAAMDFYAQHVGDWLNNDDKPKRRNLPGDCIPRFETYVGNTLVSQWLAAHAQLTVLEEITATRQVA